MTIPRRRIRSTTRPAAFSFLASTKWRAAPKRGDFAFQGSVGRAPAGDDQPANLAFFGFGMMLPDADNRITLDPSRKDAWGIPVPHIRCVMHAPEQELIRKQEKTLIDMVKGAGGDLDFIGSPLGLKEMGRGAFPEEARFSRFLFRKWFKQDHVHGRRHPRKRRRAHGNIQGEFRLERLEPELGRAEFAGHRR
jgi:hypothetical protein